MSTPTHLEQVVPAAQSQPAAAQPILEIKNLHTHFFLEKGTVKAVNGVNLTLDRQATLGVVGESGCGKSVTAMSIMRLVKWPPGKIVDGEILLHRTDGKPPVDLAKLDPKGQQMRAIRGGEIGMIFQEPMTSLNPLHTIGRQIAEAVLLHQPVSQRAALERAEEMLRRVHIGAPQKPRRRPAIYPLALPNIPSRQNWTLVGWLSNHCRLTRSSPTRRCPNIMSPRG